MFTSGKNLSTFIFTFIISTIFVKAQMYPYEMGHQNHFNPDVTNDLTDNDLKFALNDLSLNDLKSLQEFIDAEDYKDMDNLRNGPMANGNYDLDLQQFHNVKDLNSEQDVFGFQQRNNEERNKNDYIKQLAYSFPQYEQQNKNNDDLELEKLHVRVKRN